MGRVGGIGDGGLRAKGRSRDELPGSGWNQGTGKGVGDREFKGPGH